LYIGATATFMMSLLAKPTAVIVPLIAVVLVRQLWSRPWRQCVRELGSWSVISIFWIVLTSFIESHKSKVAATPLWTRPLIASDAFTFYLAKFVAPLNLCIDYGRTPVWLLSQNWVYFVWLIPFSIFIVTWLLRKRVPQLAVSLGVFAIAILPTLGFIPFVFQAWSTVADRYLYFALIGPAIGLSMFLKRMEDSRIYALATVVLVLLCGKTYEQTSHWYNTISLYQNAVDVNPTSAASRENLGLSLLLIHQVDAAAVQYMAALQLQPNAPQHHFSMGWVYSQQGKKSEAIREYQIALRLNPNFKLAQQELLKIQQK
jgi:protein O-mannosyl-transferase